MISFKEQQKKIIEFIKNNLPAYYNEEAEIINDFLDFDRYKKSFCLFVDFSRCEFTTSSFNDDCDTMLKLNMTIFLVFRNDTIANLQDKMLDATYGFYRMIRDNPTFETAYNSTISGIDFYKYAEANKYLVCSEFSLVFEIAA